jgi:hypothetical protein
MPKDQELYQYMDKKFGVNSNSCWSGVKVKYPDQDDEIEPNQPLKKPWRHYIRMMEISSMLLCMVLGVENVGHDERSEELKAEDKDTSWSDDRCLNRPRQHIA